MEVVDKDGDGQEEKEEFGDIVSIRFVCDKSIVPLGATMVDR